VPTIAERNAAFDAAKAIVVQLVPAMFQAYVHDDVVLRITDAALTAAALVRAEKKGG